jgi:1-deoxypentalenic acid 11beta-hydroxylase
MTTRSIGELVDSADILDDPAALTRLFDRDGYLYLSNVLDVSEVTHVREGLVAALQAQGAVAEGSTEPIWTGMPITEIDDNPLYAQESYQALCESPTTMDVLERVFGVPVVVFRSTTIRYSVPNDEQHVTPPHQDHFFIGPNDDFRTAWIPLMEIPRSVGGLCLGVASHQNGIRPHVEDGVHESYILKGRRQKGVPPEQIPEEWASTDFAPGDILIFHSSTIHWALPNHSDKLRLSLDTRAQPRATELSFQSRNTILEQRAHRAAIEHIANEIGATREQFEAVSLEMLQRGLEPTRETVQGLVDALGSVAVD